MRGRSNSLAPSQADSGNYVVLYFIARSFNIQCLQRYLYPAEAADISTEGTVLTRYMLRDNTNTFLSLQFIPAVPNPSFFPPSPYRSPFFYNFAPRHLVHSAHSISATVASKLPIPTLVPEPPDELDNRDADGCCTTRDNTHRGAGYLGCRSTMRVLDLGLGRRGGG